MSEAVEEEKSDYSPTVNWYSNKIFGANLDEVIKHTPMPENPFVESEELPEKIKWFSYYCYYVAFIVAFVWFLYSNYEQGRTQSFISLNPQDGVCKTDPKSSTCCEVPLSLSGDFLGDTTGNWSTESGFQYTRALYGMTTSGLQYTNEEFTKTLNVIANQLKTIGKRAIYRDYSWNIIALASYVVYNHDLGELLFYSTGDAGILYDKTIYAINMGSGSSMCMFDWTSSYSPASSSLLINFDLNTTYNGEPNCPGTDSCRNPCPDAVSLNTFGYDSSGSTTPSSSLSISFQMTSITTALAVNLGLVVVDNLIEVKNDNARLDLFNRMNKTGISALKTNYTFSSYYDVLYAPMDPVYCITFHDLKNSQCFIRIGNTLVYPMTSSWGYYDAQDTTGVPKKCSKSSLSNQYGKYYCNLFDIVIGFIYYTNTECDTISNYTNRRALSDYDLEKELLEESDLFINLFSSSSNSSNSSSSGSYYGSDSSQNNSYAYGGGVGYSYSSSYSSYSSLSYSEFSNSSSYSYSDLYNTDDFQPSFQHTCYDNGLIFNFARAVSLVYANFTTSSSNNETGASNGDTFVLNLAYHALVDTILYDETNANQSFNKLCSGQYYVLGQLIPGNCGLLAIEFYGGDDLHISEYYYQPNSIAYANTIYNKNALTKLGQDPPTHLVQSYYDCVLSPQAAFFTATGLAFSNASLYSSLFFIAVMFIIIKYMLYIRNTRLPNKLQSEIEADKKARESDELLQFVKKLKEINLLTRLDALNEDILSRNKDNFSKYSKLIIDDEKKIKREQAEKKMQSFELEIDVSNPVLDDNKIKL